MTDIIEVAKKCGFVTNNSGEIFHPDDERDDLPLKDLLQVFADHYRKEGADELERLTALCKEAVQNHQEVVDSNFSLLKKLAATELVVEQMREALNKVANSQCLSSFGEDVAEAAELQPCLSALRAHEVKVLEDAGWKMGEEARTILFEMASELRAKGDAK